MPDLWPWLQDNEQEENDNDNWSNRTDPLLARQFPNSAEVARIEEEDMRRAIADGVVTMPLLSTRKKRAKTRYVRLAFAILATFALLALIADSALITFALLHTHRTTPVVNGVPTLTLSSNIARVGQMVTLHINHFTPNTHVLLTHDIGESMQLATGTALIKVSGTGSDDVTMVVDPSWMPGFHTINAEDYATRYTASATLYITGSGPTRPSHLVLSPTTLDLGSDIVGANTIQQLTLTNSGGGSISWSASTNQPWLLLSPASGMFSASQVIEVAGERANLKPGNYQGVITFSSNVGGVQQVQVTMTVQPLSPNSGPVLQVTPALLSFTALDGGANPNAQVLMIANPGSQPLHWSLGSNTPNNSLMLAGQNLIMQSLNGNTNWLSTDQTSGTVVPNTTAFIRVYAQSQNLLPGVYTDELVFNGDHNAVDNPQSIYVSLTVQRNCGLMISTGGMSFTAVSGQGNPSNRSLSISTTSSCNGTVNWNAVSNASWLAITPASGQLKGTTSTVSAVGVNTNNLKPGTYTSSISFVSTQSTQTLMVQLTVQAPPSPTTPIMAAAPLNLNFSTTQGTSDPPPQIVTVNNTGGGALYWHTQVQILASAWLWATPSGGTIAPNQTTPLTIGVTTAGLTPNTYVGQVTLFGLDDKGNQAPGSPQVVTVTLVVLPPCTLAQPSGSSIAFSATTGSGNPSPQTESITASGNCAWPVSWRAKATSRTGWLKLSPNTGTLSSNGQSATLAVSANIAGLAPGNYNVNVAITAIDSSNMTAQGSPQYFTVTLTVLPPCTLQLSNTSLTFSASQGQSPSPQNLTLSETGNCALPVNWTASGNTAWLNPSPTSGSDNGSGATVSVGISSANLSPGTYTGTVTITATGSGGAPVQGSPQTVTVTLTISGYSISGTIMACLANPCINPKPLPGATVTLAPTSGGKGTTTTADGNGNYSFPDVALGSYTITANGSDGILQYSGTLTVSVTGNQTGVNVDAYAP